MKQFLTLLLVCGLSLQVWAQSVVKGTVTDSQSGQPLEGATVLVKGTTVGMFTDDDGNYRLELPANAEILVFTYVGKVRLEVPLAGRSVVNVTMESDDVSLEEVVVTGYSTQSREKSISSVAIIGKEAVENVPMPDVNQLIQGRAPGVYSTSSSGQPGAAQTIRIRGTGSISGGRNPLYVIDGIIINNGDFTTQTQTNDVLSNINPNDIESINILKDATATALYGARAANGVVVITTKQGREGKTQFTLRGQYGFTEPNLGNWEMMNAQQQLQFEREVLEDAGFTPAEVEGIRPSSLANVDTDWIDLAFRTGTQQMYELSASGGSNKTQFFVSGNFFGQEGILIESAFNRYSVRSNIRHKANDKLDFTLNFNASYTDQLNATAGNRFSSPLLGAFINSPWTRYKDPVTGELLRGNESPDIINHQPFVGDNFVRSVPLNPVTNNNLRTIGSFSIGYEIIPGLRIQEKVGIDFVSIKEINFFDPTTNDGINTNGSINNAYNENITYTSQTLLTGATTLGENHNIDALAAFEFQKNDRNSFSATGVGLATGKLKTLRSTAEPTSVDGFGTEFAFISYLGQVNYNFKDRYYVIGSFRRDGSSRFGANNRWANFYSVGASWRISEEPFMDNIGFISNLKIRASHGTSGNANIGNFQSLGLYSFGGAYSGTPASALAQVPNPDLTWEKQEITNLGLDFGFFNERITGSVEVYNRDSRDLLLQVPLSATSGLPDAIQNIGEVNNQGLEGTLSVKIIDGKNFKWVSDFNISFNRNELVALSDTNDIIDPAGGFNQIYRVGNPIRSWYLREWAGVNPADGTPLWLDGEGGVTGDWGSAPREIVGNAEPNFLGGWTNTISYKGLSLSAFFYFVQGQESYLSSTRFIDSDASRFGWNHITDAANRWRNPGDISDRPQALPGGNNNANAHSTRYLDDGSYIRLRNATVAYNLPIRWIDKVGLTGVRIYAQGQNLITITDFRGYDPELAEAGDEFFRYPNGKVYNFGVDVNF